MRIYHAKVLIGNRFVPGGIEFDEKFRACGFPAAGQYPASEGGVHRRQETLMHGKMTDSMYGIARAQVGKGVNDLRNQKHRIDNGDVLPRHHIATVLCTRIVCI